MMILSHVWFRAPLLLQHNGRATYQSLYGLTPKQHSVASRDGEPHTTDVTKRRLGHCKLPLPEAPPPSILGPLEVFCKRREIGFAAGKPALVVPLRKKKARSFLRE